MMQAAGEFRRYADQQAAENTVTQRRVQNALRDAAARIDALEKRCLELDAACCEYQRARDMALLDCEALRPLAQAQYGSYSLAARLLQERDEARRDVCELRCNPPSERFIGLPHELAKVIGWDCFKDERASVPDMLTQVQQ